MRIWAYNAGTQAWAEEDVLAGHKDWVRDVAWTSNVSLPRAYLAMASQDQTILVWRTKDTPGVPWVKTVLDPAAVAPDALRLAPGIWGWTRYWLAQRLR